MGVSAVRGIDSEIAALKSLYMRGIERCDAVLADLQASPVPAAGPRRALQRAMAAETYAAIRTGRVVSLQGRLRMARAQRKRRKREWAEKIVGAIRP
jgi:hypothetical protein